MKFKKKDPYYADSECKKYRISASKIGGKTVYSAWMIGKSASLEAGVSLKEAKAACVEDSKRQVR